MYEEKYKECAPLNSPLSPLDSCLSSLCPATCLLPLAIYKLLLTSYPFEIYTNLYGLTDCVHFNLYQVLEQEFRRHMYATL